LVQWSEYTGVIRSSSTTALWLWLCACVGECAVSGEARPLLLARLPRLIKRMIQSLWGQSSVRQ
jgi:hypothetical protein